MTAQICFQEDRLSLIHIPLDLYSEFLQPMLQVLLPPSRGVVDGPPHDQGFLNVSITPLECSVVCSSAVAAQVFEPAIARLPEERRRAVSVSRDTYAVFSVSVFSAATTEAGKRVVDLTSPLALAGVPIFFITTYYADWILVPTRRRQSVTQALLARGFEFSEQHSSFTAPPPYYHAGNSKNNNNNNNNNNNSGTPPSTPPPSTAEELQARTFALLKKRRVVPYVEPGLRLVQCSGRERCGVYASHRHHAQPPSSPSAWVDTADTLLYAGLVAAVASQPRFLSVTLAQDDPPSLLLDRTLVPVFFGERALQGSADDGGMVPIFLDLRGLPVEATGIVSGVAGRLVRDMQMCEGAELSYLSTARAGAVILSSEDAKLALEVLAPLLKD